MRDVRNVNFAKNDIMKKSICKKFQNAILKMRYSFEYVILEMWKWGSIKCEFVKNEIFKMWFSMK